MFEKANPMVMCNSGGSVVGPLHYHRCRTSLLALTAVIFLIVVLSIKRFDNTTAEYHHLLFSSS